MEDKLYSINQLLNVPLMGSTRSRLLLTRLVREFSLIPKSKSPQGADLYSLTEFENAMKQHDARKTNNRRGCIPADNTDLRQVKLKKEIQKLEGDIEKQDLQIEKLKDTLCDTEEALDYLVRRYTIETALLKKILVIDSPTETTGLSIPAARKKGEEYFNEIQTVLNQTVEQWAEKFGLAVKTEYSTNIPTTPPNEPTI